MALHYKSCGLTNVWLKSGYKAHETKYGISYSYEDIDGLYCAIAIQLCVGQWEVKPEVLRFLRKRLGYSQGELGAEFGCTSQAVAKWEKGTSKVPVAVARLVRLLCLNKLSPSKSLHDAFEANNTLPMDRLEFEYTNSMWKFVGARLTMPDIQTSNFTHSDFIKCVSNDPVYSVRNYSIAGLAYERKTSINEAIYNEIDIPQETHKAVAFRVLRAAKAGFLNIYKAQDANTIRNVESTSTTTPKRFKLGVDSITHGNC